MNAIRLFVATSLLLVIGCSRSYRYELTVTVVSIHDGSPIADVEVRLLSPAIGEVSTAVTDESGVCKLKAELDIFDFELDADTGERRLHGLSLDEDKIWSVSIKYLGTEYTVSCPASREPARSGSLVAASMALALMTD